MEYTQQDIENNLGLVYQTAHRYKGTFLNSTGFVQFEDLVSSGTLGLIHAFENFDPERGTAFSSFAVKCIWGYLQRNHRELFRKEWSDYTTVPMGEGIEEFYLSDDREFEGIETLDYIEQFWVEVAKTLSPRQLEVFTAYIRSEFDIAKTVEAVGCSRQRVDQHIEAVQAKARKLRDES